MHPCKGHRWGRLVTAGVRFLCADGLDDSVGGAQGRAFALVQSIRWRDMSYRTDIGHRAIAREAAS